jgi:hypothetical protein
MLWSYIAVYQSIRYDSRISNVETASGISMNYGNKRCRNCLSDNRKHFILMKQGNLWKVVPNALKSRAIAKKIRRV